MTDYTDLGNLSSEPSERPVYLWCDTCLVTWTGPVGCPMCGVDVLAQWSDVALGLDMIHTSPEIQAAWPEDWRHRLESLLPEDPWAAMDAADAREAQRQRELAAREREAEAHTLYDDPVLALAGQMDPAECAAIPTDLAANVDAYLYGGKDE